MLKRCLYSLLFLSIFASRLSFAEVYKIDSDFLQYLDFESPIPVYTEEETQVLERIIVKLLSEKTTCSLLSLDYSYRTPELEEVGPYKKTGIVGWYNKLWHSLYGDVWQIEMLDAEIECGEDVSDFKMTHYIEDGFDSSNGYWMEVRISFYDLKEQQEKIFAVFLSGAQMDAGITEPTYVDRDSLSFN